MEKACFKWGSLLMNESSECFKILLEGKNYGARKLTKVSEFESERSEIFVCQIS